MQRNISQTHDKNLISLEIDLHAETEYSVGTGERVAGDYLTGLRIGLCHLVVVVVVSLEVGSRQGNLVGSLVAYTETGAIAVDDK